MHPRSNQKIKSARADIESHFGNSRIESCVYPAGMDSMSILVTMYGFFRNSPVRYLTLKYPSTQLISIINQIGRASYDKLNLKW